MEIKFLNIGFQNMVSVSRIISIVTPDSAPIKRIISESKKVQKLIDATCGRPTRSVIITDSDHVVLSTVQPETLAARMNGKEQ